MINKQNYAQLLKYSRKFAKNPIDIEDIAQEAAESILRNPIKNNEDVPKKYYFTVVSRAAYRYYYDKHSNGNKKLRNAELLVSETDYNEACDSLLDENPLPDKLCMYKNVLSALHNIKVNNGHYKKTISLGEQKVLVKILNNPNMESVDYADRTEYYKLEKKLIRMFS